MTTVIDSVECPQCSYQDGWFLYHCHTGEESLLCPACGYLYELRILVDRHKSTPERKVWKCDRTGDPILRRYRKPGYGVVSRFKHPPSDEEIRRRIQQITTDARIDPNASYVTRWEDASGQLIAVFGQIPPALNGQDKWADGEGCGESAELDGDACLCPGEIPF